MFLTGALASMLVAMMDIRVMGVSMLERLVNMFMRVRFPAIPVGAVLVLMVLVMAVRVIVHEVLVAVPVLVTFSQVQPHSGGHE
jgi:hypothetical protein